MSAPNKAVDFILEHADKYAKAKAKRIQCVSNLKQQTVACALYTSDHDDRFPTGVNPTTGAPDPIYTYYSYGGKNGTEYVAQTRLLNGYVSLGGVRVNHRIEALDQDLDPIPGLYAAGETMGTYYANYTGATSVMKGAVFGRIAGLHAAGRPA